MKCVRIGDEAGIIIRCDHDQAIQETVLSLVKQIAFQDSLMDGGPEKSSKKVPPTKREKTKRIREIGKTKIELWNRFMTALWPGETCDVDVIVHPIRDRKIPFNEDRRDAGLCKFCSFQF